MEESVFGRGKWHITDNFYSNYSAICKLPRLLGSPVSPFFSFTQVSVHFLCPFFPVSMVGTVNLVFTSRNILADASPKTRAKTAALLSISLAYEIGDKDKGTET